MTRCANLKPQAASGQHLNLWKIPPDFTHILAELSVQYEPVSYWTDTGFSPICHLRLILVAHLLWYRFLLTAFIVPIYLQHDAKSLEINSRFFRTFCLFSETISPFVQQMKKGIILVFLQ